MASTHDELDVLKVTYDVATLFRVLPWVFIAGDTRDVGGLVRRALEDVRRVVEDQTGEPVQQRPRVVLMRLLATNLFLTLGIRPDPALLEMLLQHIEGHVDGLLKADYDDGLTGESA